jgi:2-aminoadipate transaminase
MTIKDGAPDGPGRRARPTAHELARYEALFARRTAGMSSSAIRDLLAITERPEVISLAGGLPDTSLFGAELMAKLMAAVAVESSARALQYGPTEGLASVRECVARVMEAEGTMVDPDDVVITTGGQQGIDLACKVLINPGDVIVAEAPTYPGAVPAFGAYEAEVVQIELDDDGLPIDQLAVTLDRLAAAGKTPKFIYTIPNFQNPGGVTMSLERRRALVALARERELIVLEDNPYGLLRYEGDPLPTLYSLDAAESARADAADFVIYLGTMSKILSPGLRIGWLIAPRPLQSRINLGKQAADLCSSSFGQFFAATYFRDADWLGYIDRLRDVYRRRRDAILAALSEFFPAEATWTTPSGGMFVWATLPEYIDTTDLLARAVETENVAFVPGRGAFTDGRGASSMRLNFSGVDEQLIREGIRRIGSVIAEQVAMYGTLTGGAQAAGSSAGSGRRLGASHQVAPPSEAAPVPSPAMADVVHLPRRDGGDAGGPPARRPADR